MKHWVRVCLVALTKWNVIGSFIHSLFRSTQELESIDFMEPESINFREWHISCLRQTERFLLND